MTFNQSDEQQAILTHISQPGPITLAINAGPGCGKTSTVMLCLQALTQSVQHTFQPATCKYVYVVFNKDMQHRAARDMISFGINTNSLHRAQCLTLNSLGHRLWDTYTFNPGRRLQVTDRKMGGIISALASESTSHSYTYDEIQDLKTLARFAKSQGYLPPTSGSAYKSLVTFEEICTIAEIAPEQHLRKLLDQALKTSIRQAHQQTIDFDDQLYMPVFFGGDLAGATNYLWLFVDEAQDLNPVQDLLITRLKPTNLVIVGDPLQAIYGFRGAMTDSFTKVAKRATKLPLQTSFRLPTSAVNLLKETNPALKSSKSDPGHCAIISEPTDLASLHEWYWPGESYPAPSPSAILCRNNAPLYRAALACIGSNLPFQLKDNSWGEALIWDIQKALPDHQHMAPKQAIPLMIKFWLDKGQRPEIAADKASALVSLSKGANCDTVPNLISAIKATLAKSSSETRPPKFILSTAHKAKGGEWPLVIHLSPSLIPSKYATSPESMAQETNIAYVINSRTLHTLLFMEADLLVINPNGLPATAYRPKTAYKQVL